VRILVIEDQAANLELMDYLLSAFGHTPISARDGNEGVQKARSEQPDIILCDIQLPGEDGYQILRRLRADPLCQQIPVIAVTAFAMVGDQERILASGFNGYVSKPIDTETFVSQIESFGVRSVETTGLHGSQRPPRRRRILVVDNWQANVDFARGLLESQGYEVIATSSAREALARAAQEQPDLILSDVEMAEGSGYDFLRTVKATPRLAGIPFVFISSTFTTEEARQKALAMGASLYLIRPMEPQDLLAALQACLDDAISSS
jgi:two-component system cell cycle response regulator